MPAETPLDVHTANLALCRALGIEDTADVASVDVRIRPGQWPVIRLVRNVRTAEPAAGVQQVVSQFELVMRTRQVG
jgi:hypothetical protein